MSSGNQDIASRLAIFLYDWFGTIESSWRSEDALACHDTKQLEDAILEFLKEPDNEFFR